MGIYIKGMEMPVSCWYCDPDFAYAINCNEWKRDDFPHFTTSRPDTCPLTESAEAVDCTEFILWILHAIMDAENWELNAVANGEVIARKLKKLGLLEVKDGYYVRTPSAETALSDIEKWRMWSHTYDNMCQGGDDE